MIGRKVVLHEHMIARRLGRQNLWRACRKPTIRVSEMDQCRKDGRGRFVAYEASFGGGGARVEK